MPSVAIKLGEKGAVMGKAGEFDTWTGFKTYEAGTTGAGDALRRRIHQRLAGSILTGALLGDRMRNTALFRQGEPGDLRSLRESIGF